MSEHVKDEGEGGAEGIVGDEAVGLPRRHRRRHDHLLDVGNGRPKVLQEAAAEYWHTGESTRYCKTQQQSTGTLGRVQGTARRSRVLTHQGEYKVLKHGGANC